MSNEPSFLECLSIRCNVQAKQLICKAMTTNYTILVLFQFKSFIILGKLNAPLVSTEMIKDEMHKQLEFSYLTKKISIDSL